MANRWGNIGNSGWLYFSGLQELLQMVIAAMKLKDPWKEHYDQPRQHIEKQRYYFINKGPSSQGYGFSNGHVWMWELDYKEIWVPKNQWFWTVVLEKTLESPLDYKEIQPVHLKRDQSWVFIGRTDAESETPILWPPDVKSWLIWKDPDAGKDWRQEEKGTTGWDSWMASLTQWTWVWVNSGSWWWTGRPGVLRFMGSQRVGHDWATELNWSEPGAILRSSCEGCLSTHPLQTPVDMGWHEHYWVEASPCCETPDVVQDAFPNAEWSRTSTVLWLSNPG